MDRLGMCMDELRVLARSNDPDRAVSVEGHIDTYLTAETVSVWQALERLCKGIRDEQAKGRQPTSNSEPTLRDGAGCLRNSHVAFGILGDGGLVSGGYARRVWFS
jgi:hypothetical protein